MDTAYLLCEESWRVCIVIHPLIFWTLPCLFLKLQGSSLTQPLVMTLPDLLHTCTRCYLSPPTQEKGILCLLLLKHYLPKTCKRTNRWELLSFFQTFVVLNPAKIASHALSVVVWIQSCFKIWDTRVKWIALKHKHKKQTSLSPHYCSPKQRETSVVPF